MNGYEITDWTAGDQQVKPLAAGNTEIFVGTNGEVKCCQPKPSRIFQMDRTRSLPHCFHNRLTFESTKILNLWLYLKQNKLSTKILNHTSWA